MFGYNVVIRKRRTVKLALANFCRRLPLQRVLECVCGKCRIHITLTLITSQAYSFNLMIIIQTNNIVVNWRAGLVLHWSVLFYSDRVKGSRN